jgi:tetratricopeptide (TPR) repeat protein
VPRRKAVSSGQTNALVQAGLEALERKEFTAAIADFSKASRAKGDSASYFLLGYAYYQRGFISGDPDRADKQDAVEAVNAFGTALALDPSLEQLTQPYKLYHALAMCDEALGSYEKAVDAYKKAFQAAPHNPMLPLYAARLRYRMNDLRKSSANLELALQLAKKEGKAKSIVRLVETDPLFAVMLQSDGNLAALRALDPGAQAAAAPAAQAPAASPAAFASNGFSLKDATMVRDSVRGTTPAEDRTATLRAQDKDVLDALAAANDDFKFRSYRNAINGYNDALSLNMGSGILTPTQVAFIWERIGTAYNKLGQSAQAIHALRKCVQDAPMDASAHYQLALAYAVLGRYQESVHALGETFRSSPSNGELKKFMLLAKTDSELEPVRDLPAFQATLDEHRSRAMTR